MKKIVSCLVLCLPLILFGQCGYLLVFEDDFNGASLDANTWSYQLGDGGWGNAELQNYTNTNATLSNGILSITATEPTPGYYESSRIRSKSLQDFKYGKIEARIKLPEGQGIWPAFWMMPTCDVYGGWPSSGEIDIMEYLGHDTNTVYGTCHYGNSPTDKDQSGSNYNLASGGFNDDFHIFSIEWSENTITWYVDNVQYHAIDQNTVPPYNYPFNEDFHFILNVAVGGNWPGNPDATTSFPQTMEIDYVRVYQEIEDFQYAYEPHVFPNTSSYTVQAPQITGAKYYWYPPECTTVVGSDDSSITLDWQDQSGDVEVVAVLPCTTFTKTLAVDMSYALNKNGGFESGKKYWNADFFNGAWGSFALNDVDYFSGVRSGCLDVQNLGNNFWDAQLKFQSVPVASGNTYMLEFYAKSDQNDRQMRVDFRDASDNSSYGNATFQITNQWTYYSVQFTPPITINQLVVDFNHGFETGVWCYDAVSFSEQGPIIVSCPSSYCVDSLELGATPIEFGTYQASNFIESSNAILNTAVSLKSGDCILLESGFEADAASDFSAEIEGCTDY